MFVGIPEDSTRVAALLTGSVDLILNPPPQDWLRLEDAGMVADSYLSNVVLHLELRSGASSTCPEWDGPTKDPRVRQAISFAGERVIIQSSPIFLMQREVTEVVGAMLEVVGINVDLRIMDATTFREQVYFTYRNDEIYFFATKNTFQDPWITMLGYMSDRGERVGWTGPEADEGDRLARAAEVDMDPEERAAKYRRIQELIMAESGGALLTRYQMDETMGRTPNVEFLRGPDGWLWFGMARID